MRTMSCPQANARSYFDAGSRRPQLGLAIKRLEDRLHEAEVVDQQPCGSDEEVAVLGDVEVIDGLGLVGLDRVESRRYRRPSSGDRRP